MTLEPLSPGNSVCSNRASNYRPFQGTAERSAAQPSCTANGRRGARRDRHARGMTGVIGGRFGNRPESRDRFRSRGGVACLRTADRAGLTELVTPTAALLEPEQRPVVQPQASAAPAPPPAFPAATDQATGHRIRHSRRLDSFCTARPGPASGEDDVSRRSRCASSSSVDS
jgi:hypothetical protein